MSIPESQPAAPKPERRWYHPTPDWVVLGLMVVEGFLILSQRFQWFAFNEHKGRVIIDLLLFAVACGGAAVFLWLIWFAASLLFRFRFQLSTRSLLMLVAAVGLPCGWHYYALVVVRQMDRDIGAAIYSLAGKRPPTMTRGQWAGAINWTHSLYCNSSLFYDAKIEDLRHFQGALKERVSREADMGTISWIWDQFASLTPSGEWCRQHHWPQMLEQIRAAGPTDTDGLNVP